MFASGYYLDHAMSTRTLLKGTHILSVGGGVDLGKSEVL
jgi:hypothetical protein